MRYRQSPTIETSPVGDRAVLYDNVSRKAIVLNPTGALLWKQLSTRSSTDELVQNLQARFPQIDAAQLQSDVAACLQSLIEQEFLHEEA